jgi:general secretion pathway protein K
MTRRGAALLTALWLVAALAGAAGATLALTRVGVDSTRNRMVLARAEWGREACGEILLARYAERRAVTTLAPIGLGRGTWCRALVEDAGTRLDMNRASPEMIRLVLRDDSLSDALLDWTDADDEARPSGAEAEWYRHHARRTPRNGPLASPLELGYVRGFDSARVRVLERLFTTRGTGLLDVNAAPEELLAALPGMTAEAVAVILIRRARRIESPEELLGLLSRSARDHLLARYQDFTAAAGFAPSQYVVRLEGGVRGTPIVSCGWLTLVPTAGRLAVIRREVE